jgi:hypothetical protein
MRQYLVLACFAVAAITSAHGAGNSAAEISSGPPAEPVSATSRIAGAQAFSLQAAQVEGAFGAALSDFSRHLVLETPAEPFVTGMPSGDELREAPSVDDLVIQRIGALSRRAGEQARGLYRIEEALDGLEGVASKGLGLVRIRLDAGDGSVEPGFDADAPALEPSLNAARDLIVTTSLTMDLRAETATLLERVQSLPRNPEDESDLPAAALVRLVERTKRLIALMDAGAIGPRATRPANWHEAVRDSLERLTASVHAGARERPTQDMSYATVDGQLLLAFLRLQSVQADLYAKDLARFFDRSQSFPLADHRAQITALNNAFKGLRQNSAWPEAYRVLKAAYKEEVLVTNELAADYNFKLIADYADNLPRQRSLCIQSSDAAFGDNMVHRINAIVTFNYGMHGNLAVTTIGRGPIVREPTASRVLPDGFEPDCIDVNTGNPEGVAERLEAHADEIIAVMRLQLSQVDTLARHANLMRDISARAEVAADELEAMNAALSAEPKLIARNATQISCALTGDIGLKGKTQLDFLVRARASGEVVNVDVIPNGKSDFLQSMGRSATKRLHRKLRSAFTCQPYEPFMIDGKAVAARKKVTVTLSE